MVSNSPDDEDEDVMLEVPVWYRHSHAGSQWFEAGIEIPATAFPLQQLIFRSIKGNRGTDNIAIDDITFLNSTCFGDDHSCAFELGYCGYTLDGNGQASWRRWKGSSPTSHTGPDGDAYTGSKLIQ